jgi:hypothetical protein
MKDYDITRAKPVISCTHRITRACVISPTFCHDVLIVYVVTQFFLQMWIPIMFKEHWVMYYINLVHSQIDIFDSIHWRPQDILELHDKLKDKT